MAEFSGLQRAVATATARAVTAVNSGKKPELIHTAYRETLISCLRPMN
jgi:hypothetical protein